MADSPAHRSGTLYKATRPDRTTRNGVRWTVGEVTTHPTSTAMIRDDAATYLSLSVEPAETLIGGSWPCRLFEVAPVGDGLESSVHRHKRGVLAANVIREVEPWRALGPNGRTAAAVIDRCQRLTPAEIGSVPTTQDAARDAVRIAARGAALNAALDAARDAALDATCCVARYVTMDDALAAVVAAAMAAAGVVVRDVISTEQYDLLTGPLVSIVGPLDDLPVPACADQIGDPR